MAVPATSATAAVMWQQHGQSTDLLLLSKLVWTIIFQVETQSGSARLKFWSKQRCWPLLNLCFVPWQNEWLSFIVFDELQQCQINRQCSHHAEKDRSENEILSSNFFVSRRSRFSFMYFNQYCWCNDLDSSETGRDCMFCKFRRLSDVQRYQKCDSNVAMRGCSAPAQQNMHFIFSINHANSTYFATIILDNIHSSNQKIFHKHRIHRYWIKVSGIFVCPMNLVELNEWIKNEILSSNFFVSRRSRFSFMYFIQFCWCNDLDCSETGRDCMFCKFRRLSDVQRYKKCNSNVAMRGCSAPAQQNMHFFSINHANSSYFAAVISDNIHSSNRKIFHKRRIHSYWIKVSGIFACPMNLVELNEWIICRQSLQQIRHLPRCFSRLLALLAIWFNSVVDWCCT